MRLFNSFIFLSVALVTFFTSCNTPSIKTESAAMTADSTKSINDRIVFIDIDSLLSKYNLYVDKKAELEGESKTAEKALAGKIEAFRKRSAKFQQEVMEIQQKANTIAPIELKKMEEKYALQQQNLANEEEALMKQRDNAAMDLDKKLQETQKDLQKKIDDFLDKVAAEKGYDLVLMKGSTGSVMFGKNTLDITEDTVTRLNEEYAAEKNEKK